MDQRSIIKNTYWFGFQINKKNNINNFSGFTRNSKILTLRVNERLNTSTQSHIKIMNTHSMKFLQFVNCCKNLSRCTKTVCALTHSHSLILNTHCTKTRHTHTHTRSQNCIYAFNVQTGIILADMCTCSTLWQKTTSNFLTLKRLMFYTPTQNNFSPWINN